MPRDAALVVLALALAANLAFVVLLAVRALRARARHARPSGQATRPGPVARAAPASTPGFAADGPTEHARAEPAAQAGPREPAHREPRSAAAQPPREATGGRRSRSRRGRRFTLPPLDDDHGRTTRAIETLLEPADTARAPGATITLQVRGLDGADRSADALLLRETEALLRRCTRADDRVAAVGSGRFRVELAPGARPDRYLARVRATAAPMLRRRGAELRALESRAGSAPPPPPRERKPAADGTAEGDDPRAIVAAS